MVEAVGFLFAAAALDLASVVATFDGPELLFRRDEGVASCDEDDSESELDEPLSEPLELPLDDDDPELEPELDSEEVVDYTENPIQKSIQQAISQNNRNVNTQVSIFGRQTEQHEAFTFFLDDMMPLCINDQRAY